MFNRDWRNGLALGLFIGIFITVFFILFGEYLHELGKCVKHKELCEGTFSQAVTNQPEWWYWTRRFIAAEDTLAQWIMAAFTIVATVVLLLTLRSANKTNVAAVKATEAALEANKFIREGQRPWLKIEKITRAQVPLGRMYRSSPKEPIYISVVNKGSMPSFDVSATFIFFSHDTIRPIDAAEVATNRLLKDSNVMAVRSNAAFQNDPSRIEIFPLVRNERFLGQGDKWSVMIVCVYDWDGEIKNTWTMWTIKKPPSDVLRRQKKK